MRRARTYFLNELDEVNHLLYDEDYLARIIARQELTALNKKLVKSARKAHVTDFQYFVNEGYVGMYKLTMSEIKADRLVAYKMDLNDCMSNTELAANIFRISLTIERLKLLQNSNRQLAAREHWKVGRQIRKMIQSSTGNAPERLPLMGNLHKLQRKLFDTQKELNKVLPKIEARVTKTHIIL